MCGIVGFLSRAGSVAQVEQGSVIKAMSDRILHRGPDAEGRWSDAEAGIALGHRRLAILDVSPDGRQPMESRDGRYVLTFNGEIYNFRDLREQLVASGHAFRGGSDTEVMLAAFTQWGIDKAVSRFTGMFAFAVWDRSERTLHLYRDRLGEKPLYYGQSGKTFLFGSELKAFKAFPGWQPEVDREALALYFQHGCIPYPHTIYKGFRKLPPGTWLAIRDPESMPEPVPYWSLAEAVRRAAAAPFRGSDAEAVDELETRLRKIIRNQMLADVPLGAFLSGGLDSSTVVALMQAESARPVRTFTIGFHEKGFDESVHAREVASHLGTDHTELYVSPREAMDVIPELPEIYDEPFADVSQIPTYLVSKLTRRHVTVCLSGDGGDEILAGYNRYFLGRRLWEVCRHIPWLARKGMAAAVGVLPPGAMGSALEMAGPCLPRSWRHKHMADKLLKLAEVMSARNAEDMYGRLVSFWKDPHRLVIGSGMSPGMAGWPKDAPEIKDLTERMMYLDAMTYLPSDILVKVDRASMRASLESRAPLLDHELMEFAWSLPMSMKIRNGQGKWLLRQVLYRHVPRSMVERPKMGFGVPVESWLRGPLRDWGESLLQEDVLKSQGFLDAGMVRAKWREHQSKLRNWHYQLWNVLMFQSWMGAQR